MKPDWQKVKKRGHDGISTIFCIRLCKYAARKDWFKWLIELVFTGPKNVYKLGIWHGKRKAPVMLDALSVGQLAYCVDDEETCQLKEGQTYVVKKSGLFPVKSLTTG